MVLDFLLDPVLSPLLRLHSLLSIFLISFIIVLFTTLIYKKVTDQSLMKRLKDEIKELQAEMKTLRNSPEKMMEVQKKAMETNMKYMMQSFKPMLYTLIPLLLVFGWLNTHMAFMPLVAEEQFSVTAEFVDNTEGRISLSVADKNLEILNQPTQEILNDKAEWVLRGEAGEYILRYDFNGQQFQNSIIITTGEEVRRYLDPELTYKELGLDKFSRVKKVVVGNEKIHPFQSIPLIKSIPWIGGFGWLGVYILFSIILSIGLRKLLKVY